MIQIVRDNSPQEFLSQVGRLLYQDEPSNSLMVGLCESMLAIIPRSPPLLLRIIENNQTVSAAIQTPPMNLILTYAKPAHLEVLADYLKTSAAEFPGVVGPANESEIFSKLWLSRSGKKTELGMGQKIYQLEKVIFPEGIAGELRVASASELQLLSKWIMAFATESLPATDQRGEQYWSDYAERAVKNKTAYFWIVNGVPVSMACATRPTKNGTSIGGVYTPPENRKHGYASAVVAHLSQKILDGGKSFCVLYTDIANPTSNKIYQKIGYVEVSDSKHFLFL